MLAASPKQRFRRGGELEEALFKPAAVSVDRRKADERQGA
jgi:hypothetical protein